MPANFDRTRAVIHFDVHFEDINFDEDMAAMQEDADARERIASIVKQGNDPTDAMLNVESATVRAFAKQLSEAVPSLVPSFGDFQITRWSHDEHGNLDCSFGVDSEEQTKAVFDFIARNTGGGEDCIYFDHYMELRGFVFFPQGINGPRYTVGGCGPAEKDIEEFFEPEEE